MVLTGQIVAGFLGFFNGLNTKIVQSILAAALMMAVKEKVSSACCTFACMHALTGQGTVQSGLMCAVLQLSEGTRKMLNSGIATQIAQGQPAPLLNAVAAAVK